LGVPLVVGFGGDGAPERDAGVVFRFDHFRFEGQAEVGEVLGGEEEVGGDFVVVFAAESAVVFIDRPPVEITLPTFEGFAVEELFLY
jgi:hypothetical protein